MRISRDPSWTALVLGALAVGSLVVPGSAATTDTFYNWENSHVHPLDLTPNGQLLVAANLADNRIEVYRVDDADHLTHLFAVPVGLDPVSVRARTNTEVWVVNHVSDSVSIVDLAARNVVATIDVGDEPGDVVFAGGRAFVSVGTSNEVWVYPAPYDPAVAPTVVPIDGQDPRAMAVSNGKVTVNVLRSALTTVAHVVLLGGPDNPYGQGVNPPPNDGDAFEPPINPVLLEDDDGDGQPDNPPPFAALIVKQNESGQWMDDNDHDWSGAIFWELTGNAMAHIDIATLDVTYTTRLMSINTAIAANPVDGRVAAVGADLHNHIRFEPNLKGRFATLTQAVVDPASGSKTVSRLNPQLVDITPEPLDTEGVQSLPPVADVALTADILRAQTLGDPQGVAWLPDGSAILVTGRGSNSIVKMSPSGARLDNLNGVPEGPTGIVTAADLPAAYVLSKFDGSVSVLRTDSFTIANTYAFHDPTPAEIKAGRPLLYDTRAHSLFGNLACATCHVDAHFDGNSWDLGDPSGDMQPFEGTCIGQGCKDFHPMKGPMFTQSLRNLDGNEPFHWRGDRLTLRDFAGAFVSLLGGASEPSDVEMDAFEAMLDTVHFPPNPYRELDGSLPDSFPNGGDPQHGGFLFGTAPNGGDGSDGGNVGPILTGAMGHVVTAEMIAQAQTLPISVDGGTGGSGGSGGSGGPAQGGLGCVGCHALPTGSSHEILRALPGQGLSAINQQTEVAPLESSYFKDGFDTALNQPQSSGTGQLHNGSIDTLLNFMMIFFGGATTQQDRLDVVSFLFCFGTNTAPAIGVQVTIDAPSSANLGLRDQMIALADAGDVALIAKGVYDERLRGFTYAGDMQFQSDRADEVVTVAQLDAAAGTNAEITYTVVPVGTETRMGIDRDEDTFLDRDEIDACADPANPASTPANACCGDFDRNGSVGFVDLTFLLGAWGECRVADTCTADLTGDYRVGFDDLTRLLGLWGPCASVEPGDPIEVEEGEALPAEEDNEAHAQARRKHCGAAVLERVCGPQPGGLTT